MSDSFATIVVALISTLGIVVVGVVAVAGADISALAFLE